MDNFFELTTPNAYFAFESKTNNATCGQFLEVSAFNKKLEASPSLPVVFQQQAVLCVRVLLGDG